MRNVECKDRERVLREQDPESLAAFGRHAAVCAICGRELRLWNDISDAARGLRRSWESPHLWPKIQQALRAEAQIPRRARGWSLPELWRDASRRALVPALASLLALMLLGTWLVIHRTGRPPGPEVHQRLLTERAVSDVEKSEKAYVVSIQKLSALAGPKIASPKTPLLAAYHEKLLVLDAAIDECRAQAERNPANPQLRQELLAMYREKQETLKQVIREE